MKLVSPDVVSSEMRRARKVAAWLDQLARVIDVTYAEAYVASLSSTSNGDGIPPGKSGFRVSDPTGDVAVSGLHIRLRFQVRKAGRKLGKVPRLLEEVEDILVEAFQETDPEIRAKLKRLRELEAAAREEANG